MESAMMKVAELVGELRLSRGELLRVYLIKNGRDNLIDLRRWYLDDHRVVRPTRKGIRLTARKAKALARLIRKTSPTEE